MLSKGVQERPEMCIQYFRQYTCGHTRNEQFVQCAARRGTNVKYGDDEESARFEYYVRRSYGQAWKG